MKNFLIAERYARGLAESLGSSREALESANEALCELGRIYSTADELQKTLSNPALPYELRRGILTDLLERVSAPEKVCNLVLLLLERNRLPFVPDVAELFTHYADEQIGRVNAVITTARPLDEAQAEAVRAAMEEYTGKEVHLNLKVDPAVLGGVVARVKGTVIDGSLRARLNQMREQLLTEEQR